jgi:nucleotide-binding universal stress UspA family protein
MKANKIVFPTDFSSYSAAALEQAASLARDTGAKLLIVHVEEPPVVYGDVDLNYHLQPSNREELTAALARVAPAAGDVKVEHHLLSGSPADEIVRFAADQRADLIVMSSHGRTGLSRLLMGSVAEAVVRRANCPVLTFKQPQAAAAAK